MKQTPGPNHTIAQAMSDLSCRSPVLAELMREHGPYLPRPTQPLDVFGSLAKSIVYQQLTGKAAATIHDRFLRLVEGPISPSAILALPVEDLRGAGLSRSKCEAVQDLARHVEQGELGATELTSLDNDTLVEALCRVRGIGPWTAQMFLMGQLGRLDVWPTGDLGVRKGFRLAFDLKSLPTARDLEPLGDPFRPYRSIVAWYCWRALDPSP